MLSQTAKFTTHDPAEGARNTNTPSYYQRHEAWKHSISNVLKNIKEVLSQHFKGSYQFRISKKLARQINCPDTLSFNDFNWMKTKDDYEKIFLQEKSKYLAKILKSN